ncbi:A/G-specific adenine glycosylase [Aeoliella mucimassa]|uniref:Adenine DNA glycosylase n=1 Tax=Aeoliella mucimassa TaxID=2527972 RepID=A0A518AUW0_9BACT|nr:A/G-specific adenine glycosylase [Aeoliella mucimassa]QDU58506.1 A/G-specific adenine glycosylase [Aeoliella mucimassa]
MKEGGLVKRPIVTLPAGRVQVERSAATHARGTAKSDLSVLFVGSRSFYTSRMAATKTSLEFLTARWKQSFRRRLATWYTKHERDLPWRKSRDPYRVWVSEVMLQQTQVATVQGYFERFTAAFPTVHHLADADEQQVLRLWEGLGYYRRARMLHAAAQQVSRELEGKFPETVEELMQLPGIGRYTAGAIVSIAYDKPAPILEANTLRLLGRLVALREDPTKSAGQKLLWGVAGELLPGSEVSRFNQALMELGSLVCTPREPKCSECPAESLCQARQLGVLEELLPTTKKTTYTDLREAALVVRRGEKVLLRQCGEGERWAGLWDFPRYAVESEGPLWATKELEEKLTAQTGVEANVGPLIKTIKHGVTRYRITLDCYDAAHRGGRLKSTRATPTEWVALAKLGDYPLSTTGRKIAKIVTAPPRR